MSAFGSVVSDLLLTLGLPPQGAGNQHLALGNGWQLRLGVQPCLHACLLIPCPEWGQGAMGERLLAQLDLRRARADALQVSAKNEHLHVLLIPEGSPNAQQFQASLEAFVRWTVNVLR